MTIDSTLCAACGHLKHIGKTACDVRMGDDSEVAYCPCNDRFAMKADAGKPRFDLIPPYAMLCLAQIYEYGTRKYEADSWRKVPDALRRYERAAQSHYNAWKRGEKLDAESGLPHLWHYLWNCVAMVELDAP
jgi:hypothetical protein